MLGTALAFLRLEAGLTRVEVAYDLRVSPSVVYQWERGASRPRHAHLAALMRLYRPRQDQLDEVAHLAAFNAPRGSL